MWSMGPLDHVLMVLPIERLSRQHPPFWHPEPDIFSPLGCSCGHLLATTGHQTHVNTSINTLGRCAVHIEAFRCVWMHLELYLGSGLGRWSDPSEGEK